MRFLKTGAAGRIYRAVTIVTLLCGWLAWSAIASAQAASAAPKANETKHEPETFATIRLVHMTRQTEALDLQMDLRNMLPMTKLYYVPAQNLITLKGSAADIEEARRLIAELDQPRKVYRLTFSLVDTENGKRTAEPVRSYVLVTPAGERAKVNLGERVPLMTAPPAGKDNDALPQIQYADVGLKIDASVEGSRLSARVEQSKVSGEKSGVGPAAPVFEQTAIDGGLTLTPGKTMSLGAFDVPGSTHRTEVQVTAEVVQ
jgi:type II secretory pathway component GspD/PulD (secretin)